MAGPADYYVRAIHDRFGYFGTWLPNAPVALGDVGFKTGRTFNKVSSLDLLSIPFRTRASAAPARFHHTWNTRLRTSGTASASGDIGIVQAGAELVVEFGRTGAFVFQAENCVESTIEDKVALAQAILDCHRHRTWDPGWSVIDTVVQAGSATILISNSGDAQIQLSATAQLPELADRLADPKLELSMRHQRGDVTRVLAQRELHPLFKLSRPRLPVLARLFTHNKPIKFGGRPALPTLSPSLTDELWEAHTPDT